MKYLAPLLGGALLLGITLNSNAQQFPGVIAASVAHVSPLSNAALAVNLNKDDRIVFGPYSPHVKSFCGISGADAKLLSFGYDDTHFTAPKDDLYLVVCIQAKTSPASGDVVVMMSDPTVSYREAVTEPEQPSEEDLVNLQDGINCILNN